MTFNVSEWLSERHKLQIQSIEIEGVEFEIMALNDLHLLIAEEIEDYEELLEYASDNGLSFNRQRVTDDEELKKDLVALWQLDEINQEVDPCIRYQVGEAVCSISGLEPLMRKLRAESDPELDGVDVEKHGDTELGELSANQLQNDARLANGNASI